MLLINSQNKLNLLSWLLIMYVINKVHCTKLFVLRHFESNNKIRGLTFIRKYLKVMGQIWHFNPTYLYFTFTDLTKLVMQIICLNVTYRMISHSLLSNNVHFIELMCEWLSQNNTFLGGLMGISPINSTFFFRIFFSMSQDSRHPCEKTNPLLIVLLWGGGG